MSHVHNITDTGSIFVIDATTKTIKKPADVPRVVQGDHNSEILSFSLNAVLIEGHNMAECDRCEIHFTNFNPETEEKTEGVYKVEDLMVSEDGSKVLFSWKISDEATWIWGALSFSVKFLCFAEDGTVSYEWNTLTSGGIPIYPGKSNTRTVLEKYPDFIEKIKLTADKCYETVNKTLTYEMIGVVPSHNEWFTFTLNADGTGYSVKANFDNEDTEKTDIVIPYKYKGLPVNTISAGAFADKVGVVSVVIPNTVSTIGSKAFQGCSSLQNVILPKNIAVLNSSLFQGCTGLTHIDLPKGIKEIQYDVFRETAITHMDLPYGIEYVGETLFFGCTALKSVNIPNSVKEIRPQAFGKCSSLVEIVIPNSVTSMGIGMFSQCSNLRSMVIGNGITTLGGHFALYCDKLERVVIPSSVTSIESNAFWNRSYVPNPNVTLYVEQGSYAEEYAKQYKMKYVYSEVGKDAISDKIAESLEDGGTVNEFLKNNQPDYNQNDETKIDYIKNRPFYEYVEETTNETIACEFTLGDFAYSNKTYFLGLKPGNPYQINLKCYKDDELMSTTEAESKASSVVKGYGVSLTLDTDDYYINIDDKSASAYHNKFPEQFNGIYLSQYWNWVEHEIFVYVDGIDRCVLTITGDFSRVKPKYLPTKFIEEGEICPRHLGNSNIQAILSGLSKGAGNNWLSSLRLKKDSVPYILDVDENGLLRTRRENGDGSTFEYATRDDVKKLAPLSDWNQVDPTQPDYIKGRPFYESKVVLIDVDIPPHDNIDETALYFDVDKTLLADGAIVSFELFDDDGTYGATRTLTENDEFLQGAHWYDEQVQVFFVFVTETGICLQTPLMIKPFKFKFTVVTRKLLDEKFIPDTIARTADVEGLESVAKGAARSHVYKTYKEMAEAFATMTADDVRVGDHIYIEQLGVPDLWISKVHETQLEGYYYYNTDESLILTFDANGSVPVNTPWFEVSMSESSKLNTENSTLKVKIPDEFSGNVTLDSEQHYPSMAIMSYYINKAIEEAIGTANAELESILAGGVD